MEAGGTLWKAAVGTELGAVGAATEVRQTGTDRELGLEREEQDVTKDLNPGDCFLEARTVSSVSPWPGTVPRTVGPPRQWKE